MAATPAAARESTSTEIRRRISKTGSVGSARDSAEERPPVNKKVKLLSPVTERNGEEEPLFMKDWKGRSREKIAPAAANTNGKATQTKGQGYLDPANLQNLRETISQQLDIEILLKHRELGLIEQEIAKTQICIEQLRRCTLKPYQSPEISLEPYTPNTKQLGNGPPDYAPPHWSVVNGPYTRHYKQWLLQDPTFDGYGPEGAPVIHAGKGTRSQKTLEQTQTYTISGRPQRQSVMKVQQRGGTGMQQCIFRKSDGTTVRLECLDCKRSDFSSAQGFINHCRIAHQREYASHEAAAQACGQPVEETEEGFASYPRNPVDPPSRDTRQTQQQVTPPQASYIPTPRGSISGPSGVVIATPPIPRITHPPKNKTTVAQRKGGNRGTRAAMTTPQRPTDQGLRRPPTPPLNPTTFKTPHLEGLLKRKKIEVDLAKMVKEVKGQRINWDDAEVYSEEGEESDGSGGSLSSGEDIDGDTIMAGGLEETKREKEVKHVGIEDKTKSVVARPESSDLGILAVTSGRSISRVSPAPFSGSLSSLPAPRAIQSKELGKKIAHPKQASTMMQNSSPIGGNISSFGIGIDGNYDYDTSSSDDEDGYKSDADAHEDVEMEIESATSHSSVEDHTPTHTAGFGLRTLPVERLSRSPGPQSSCPITNQPTVAAPISPALSITTEDIQEDIVTPARPLIEQIPSPMLTPVSPTAASLSKQVRFIMPNSKNGMRKNPGGVLETGLAKMKFGNVRKSGVFGTQEGG